MPDLIHDRIGWASHTRMIAVRDLPERLRRDYAMDKLPDGSVLMNGLIRRHAVYIDPELAELLLKFKEPSLIKDAVKQQAEATGRAPRQVLLECYEHVKRFLTDGFLVTQPEKGSPAFDAAGWAPGDQVFSFVLRDNLSAAVDTSVFLADDADQKPVVVKLGRPTPDTLERFQREKHSLAIADSCLTPRALALQHDDNAVCLVLEFLPGSSLATLMARLRAGSGEMNLSRRVALAASIARAYAALHDCNLIHGDVHAGNILISGNTPYLIDFDRSAQMGEPVTPSVGVLKHTAPHAAGALLQGSLIPANAQDEQYSVATVLFELIFGVSSVVLAPEQEAAIADILHKPVRRDVLQSQPHTSHLHSVLSRALAKNRAMRFKNCIHFAEALESAIPAVNLPLRQSSASSFYDGNWTHHGVHFLASLEEDSSDIDRSSIMSGAAGWLFVAHQTAAEMTHPACIPLAEVVSKRLLESSLLPAIRRGTWTMGLLDGHIGALLACALSNSFSEGLPPSILEDFVEHEIPHNLSLTNGSAGYMLTLASLASHFPKTEVIKRHALRILEHIQQHSLPRLTAPDGMAHGIQGVLYATLKSMRLLGQLASKYATQLHYGPFIEYRQRLLRGERSGHYLWCRGAAGELALLREGWLADDSQDTFGAAIALGDLLITTQSKNATLCCGEAAQAIGLIDAYAITQEARYLEHALKISASWAKLRHEPMGGLFYGTLGNSYAAIAVEAAAEGNFEPGTRWW
jgi:serine/threonine protein kinase